MTLHTILLDIITALLTGFLALSNGLAYYIESHFLSETASERHESISEGISAVFDQLRSNEAYQQAAAITSGGTISDASIEDALVNIYCTAQYNNAVRTTTGSGVFIHERGVILTNAHVAQFLLLEDPNSSEAPRCVIRQGSPAISKYEAELLYISPTWISNNAYQLYSERPSGTGEHDFALLHVTDAVDAELPDTFPALAPLTDDRYGFYGTDVSAAGYPVDYTGTDASRAALVPLVASTSITHLFTFGSGTVDLVSIAPSDVGKQGSSGGPVVDEHGTIVGLIVTRGNTEREGLQSLRALALPYIDRALTKETGLDLARTLSGDLALRAQVFRDTLMPYMRAELAAQERIR